MANKKTLIISILLVLLVGLPNVLGISVDIENSNYKIKCTPETASIRPVGVGYEQICEFTNKKPTSVTTDFAMLFNTALKTGKVSVLTPIPYNFVKSFDCDTEDYGVIDSENVFCYSNSTNKTVYTGTERYFVIKPVGATVYYNTTRYKYEYKDKTSFFNYYEALEWPKSDVYYIEDVTWQSGETKIVKFNYMPRNNNKQVKWDAIFGDIDTLTVHLNLDPLTNPFLYESDFESDQTTGTTTSIIDNSLSCVGSNFGKRAYFTFDNGLSSDDGSFTFTNYGAEPTSYGKVNGAYNYTRSENDYVSGVNETLLMGDNPSNWSIFFWFRTGDLTTRQVLFNCYDASVGGEIDFTSLIFFRGDLSNQLSFLTRESDTDTSTEAYFPIVANKWHSVAMTFNKYQNLTVYVDGEFKNTTASQSSGDYTKGGNCGIGNNLGASNYLQGSVDELYIYERILNSSEIKELNNTGNFSMPTSNCIYNASNFEVNWLKGYLELGKNSEQARLSVDCGENSVIDSNTGSSLVFNNFFDCSDGTTTLNLTYYINQTPGNIIYNLTMRSVQEIINVKAYDVKTVQQIANFNVTAFSDTFYKQVESSISDKEANLTNLFTGTYQLEVSSINSSNVTNYNYSARRYVVQVLNEENIVQNITAYLLAQDSVSEIVISTQTAYGGNLKNVLVKAERLINNDTWVVVDERLTDGVGRVRLNLEQGIRYRFTLSKTGYITQQFFLEPSTSDSPYTFKMTTGFDSYSSVFQQVAYNYEPSNTTLLQGVIEFNFTTTSLGANITSTFVTNNETTNNYTTGLSGGTARLTVNLSNFTGLYTVRYGFDTINFEEVSVNINYLIVENMSFENTSLISVQKTIGRELSVPWKAIIAVMTCCLIAGIIMSISRNTTGATFGAVGGTIFFAVMGFISLPLALFVTVITTMLYYATRGGY